VSDRDSAVEPPPLSPAGSEGGFNRVLNRWDLTWQAVNIVVGASIFTLPGVLLHEMGAWTIAAVLVAVAGILPIALGFAECAGRYRVAGGSYRYVADAFGDYAGAHIGVLYWVARATAGAAVADVFVTYFGELWPAATTPIPRAVILTVLVGAAAFVNVRGVKQTAVMLNLFALAKMLPLVLVSLIALFLLSDTLPASPQPDLRTSVRTVLLWIFALAGFEATLIPASEATDPQRDGPRAVLRALAMVASLYVLVQLTVVLVLGNASSQRPIAAVAELAMGRPGALLVTIGALMATSGHIVGSMLASSRLVFAMAQRGALPPALAHVNRSFNTPITSILCFAVAVWILAISGGFVWNASLSAVSRLLVYAVTSLAALRLRRRGPSQFVVATPAHVAAVCFCVFLLAYQTVQEALAVAAVLVLGGLMWRLSARWRTQLPTL
jgi:APA family basic amino acid/polyamine antiporter